MFRQSKLLFLISFFVLLVGAFSLRAEWTENVVQISPMYGADPQIAPDGAKGSIIVWNQMNDGIYAQRIDEDGNILWEQDGVLVCTHYYPAVPQVISDGQEGAIITWIDNRNGNYDVFAQRIDAYGDTLWQADGVPVCANTMPQDNVQVVSDGAGGAIITWTDNRDGYDYFDAEVYAQRIDATGNCRWTQNGVPISDNTIYDPSSHPQITTDGQGGAIIVFKTLDPTYMEFDIYAQRVDYNGQTHWVFDVPVFNWRGDDVNPRLVADGEGGAIIVCESVGSQYTSLLAQRIDHAGNVLWLEADMPLCLGCRYDQISPGITLDDDGNAVVVYEDLRGDHYKIYAQKLLPEGGTQAWDEGGVPVCVSGEYSLWDPQVTSARNAGTIITWIEGFSVYAQMLNADGDAMWPSDGVLVSTLYSSYKEDVRIVTDGSGGAFITWETDIFGIFAGRVIPEMACDVTWEFIRTSSGQPTGRDTLVACPAGDHDSLKVTLDFTDEVMSGDINAAEITLVKPDEEISFWEDGDIHADGPAQGPDYETTITHSYIGGCCICEDCTPQNILLHLHGIKIGQVDALKVNGFDINNDGVVDLSDFAFFGATYNKSMGDPGFNPCADFNLDHVINLSDFAFLGAHYNHAHPTGMVPDALPEEPLPAPIRVQLVLQQLEENAHGNKQSVKLCLENAAGISAMALGLEKIHPALEYVGWTPNPELPAVSAVFKTKRQGCDQLLIASFGMASVGNDEIEMGVLEFNVKGRAELSPDNFSFNLAFGEVLDLDGNLLRIQGVSLEEAERGRVFVNHLADNYPNPFNPATVIEFSIADDLPVNLSIYNVNGQLVRTLVDEFKHRNKYKVIWDGRDNEGRASASGVYFYKLTTKNFTMAKKLVLLK